MFIEIITVGNEILAGQTIDTDSAYISSELRKIGIAAHYHTAVGDNPERLLSVLKKALVRTDIIIVTGGLGPTVDDITLETVSRLTDKKTIQQAKLLKNKVGTAPGLIISWQKKTLIVLPGVPKEMASMMPEVTKYLKKKQKNKTIIKTRIIKITGLPERIVSRRLKGILKIKGNPLIGIYPHTNYVDLKINAEAGSKEKADQLIKQAEKKITQRLGIFIFAKDEQTLEGKVGELLRLQKRTISLAESCTGGLTANRLTNVGGSSKYFKMGVITYSDESKASILKISGRLIKKNGAVSPEVARLMAKGIRTLARSDLGLALTGIAGPGGATRTKPIGLVFIALATDQGTICRKFNFKGDRTAIKLKASEAGLDMVRRYLTKPCEHL